MIRIPSFVRRKGRLSQGQIRALDSLLPIHGIPVDTKDPLTAREGAELIIEIGFGNGDNLLALAKRHPENDYVGIEVYQAGIGTVLLDIEQEQINNLRVVEGDAVIFLENAVKENSLDKILIFFPDPWHKKRHNKRRLIQPAFIELIISRLKPNGILHLATDWQAYAEQMMTELSAFSELKNNFGANNYATHQLDRIETKFERRGVKLGHGVWDLVFSKVGH